MTKLRRITPNMLNVLTNSIEPIIGKQLMHRRICHSEQVFDDVKQEALNCGYLRSYRDSKDKRQRWYETTEAGRELVVNEMLHARDTVYRCEKALSGEL